MPMQSRREWMRGPMKISRKPFDVVHLGTFGNANRHRTNGTHLALGTTCESIARTVSDEGQQRTSFIKRIYTDYTQCR